MVESEIKILITVVDEMSKKLDNIKENITDLSKTTEKQNEVMTKSYMSTTESLIALGNTAQSVDSIFNSYQNMQIRVENATERLANAQDRQNDAMRNLQKIQSDTSATQEDILNAQNDYERATRGLTISQNNLERANNQVIGTYINMGVQIVSLAANAPKAIGALSSLATFALSAAGAATAAGAAFAALGTYLVYEHVKQLGAAAEAYDRLGESIKRSDISSAISEKGTRMTSGPKFDAGGVDISIGGYTGTGGTSMGGTSVGFTPSPTGKDKKNGVPGTWASKPTPKKDFLMRPGQPAVEFSPDDTIMGFKKGGMGITVNINGPIYGVNASDISRALIRELNNKMSI